MLALDRRTFMRFVAVVASLVAALAGQIWTAAPAAACDCTQLSDEQDFDQADAVFVGDVASMPARPTEGNWSTTDPATWTFVVTEVYKGQVAPEQRVVSVVDGASCGLELPGAGTVVVFAQSEPGMMQAAVDGATLYAYLCGGSRPLRDAVLPVSFGAPTAPTIAAAEPIRPFDTEPGLVHSDEQSLSTAVMAGIGLVILAAAGAAVLVIRRRHR